MRFTKINRSLEMLMLECNQKGLFFSIYRKEFCKSLTVTEEILSCGQLTWGDAIYLRDVDSLFRESDTIQAGSDRLLKLAAIADLLGSLDYSLFVLGKALEKYSGHFGNKLQDIKKIVAEVRPYLAKAGNPKKMMERWFGKFGKRLFALYKENEKSLNVQIETSRQSYIWRS